MTLIEVGAVVILMGASAVLLWAVHWWDSAFPPPGEPEAHDQLERPHRRAA